MSLTVAMTLLAYFFLSYILPFARDIKWIENTSSSYYEAYSWIEDAMYFIKTRTDLTQEYSTTSSASAWYSFSTTSSWNIIPTPSKWNSEYDSNFDRISYNEPLQLEVWKLWSISWSNVRFYFKVPSISSNKTLSWWTTPVINWILSSATNSLISTWSYITANDINTNNWTIAFTFDTKVWAKLDNTAQTFQWFYTDNCTWSKCSLKISIISDLTLSTVWTLLPYLEYKIDFGSTMAPLRYTKIDSKWQSYWFSRDLDVSVSQQTVNQAFDFAVFQ